MAWTDAPSSKETDLLRTVIDEFTGYIERLPYIRQLATNLHKLVLKGL